MSTKRAIHRCLAWFWPMAATLLMGVFAPVAHAEKMAEDTNAAEEPAPPVGQAAPTRTLAERIPSVTHRQFSKVHRFELYPEIGLSLTDPFYRYINGGVGLNYYVLESLALGVTAEYFGDTSSSLDIIGGAVTNPSPGFNHPAYDLRVQVSWLPLYGKISWLAENVWHFDTYLTGGVGLLGPQIGGVGLMGSLALGQHYFINDWLAIRLELRNELYSLARTLEGVKELQSLLSVSAGVCFYLPQRAQFED